MTHDPETGAERKPASENGVDDLWRQFLDRLSRITLLLVYIFVNWIEHFCTHLYQGRRQG